MDFSWTEEHKIFRETVRDFAQKEIKPIVREMDTKGEIPPKVIKGMADLGLMGMTVDEQYGGIGPNFTMACIAAEELARADISIAIPVLFLVTAAWGNVFNIHGTKQAKDEILPKITRGEWILGIATTEPGGGSDIIGTHKTDLKKKGDHYIMNGEKVYISGVRESLKYGGYHMTLGWTDKTAEHRGMTFALVPLKDNPGIEPTLFEDMGRIS